MTTRISIGGSGLTQQEVLALIAGIVVGGTPNSQPAVTGVWSDNGVPTWYDAAKNTNEPLDINQGTNVSIFGTPLGDI